MSFMGGKGIVNEHGISMHPSNYIRLITLTCRQILPGKRGAINEKHILF